MFIETPKFADSESETVEIAQAGPGGAESIGKVSSTQGSVTITHTDGTKVQATGGAPVFQGDVVETGKDGAVGITFADDSTFSLADNGSMVIDEMVYDPSTKSGTSALSVAEGVFTFVSGEIAKTSVDAMTISTPVAVIGIRGTSGGGKAGAEGFNNTFSLFPGADGATGEMIVTTQGGSQTMSSPFQTTQIASAFVPPTLPVTLPPAAVSRFFSKVAGGSPIPIVTRPTTSQTGDAAPADQSGGGNAEQAAQDAFEQKLAEGGSLEDAMAAAVDGATEAGLIAVLAVNADHFGSQHAGNSVLRGIADDFFGGLTGQFDYIGAGTGGGPGHGDLTDQFFKDPIGDLIETELGEFEGGFFDPDLFGDPGDDEFFDIFFDDPFGDFNDTFFFGDDDFFFGDEDFLFIGDDPFLGDDFFFDEGLFFDDFDDEFFFDPVVFGDEKDATSGDDILVGGVNNTEFVYAQDEAAFGGNDAITDLGGTRDRITFEALDDVALRLSNTASDSANFVKIEIENTFLSGNGFSVNNTDFFGTVANTIELSRAVEDLQALDGDFTDFNSGGTLLFGATNVTAGEAGYIVAGTSSGDTIDLSGFTTPAPIGSIIFGKGGNDTLTGTISEDDLFGGDGDDIIDGNDGINFLNGGTGNDTFNVTVAFSDNDINGDSGTDTLNYTSLSDDTTFNFGTTGSLFLDRASGGSDVVFGIEVLNAGNGINDYNFNTISLGFTLIRGGTGNDTFTFNTAGAQIAAVIDGGTGTSDSITLNAGTFLAGSGGVQNVETITGSAGNDTVKFVGAQTSVSVDLNGGGDTVTLDNATNSLAITDTETITGGTGVDTLTLNSSGAISLTAGGSADSITITTGAVTFNDLGAGNLNDIVILNGGSVSATVTGNWAATASTDNAVNNNTSFVINAASAGTVNLTNASISNGSGFGYTVLSTGTSTITGSAGADLLTNTSGNSSFAGLGAADTFTAIAGQMTITDLGAGGASDIITLTGGTVSASLAGASVMNGTSNAGAVGDFVINVASTGQLNMGSATGGFTIISTGTSTILGSSSADALTNTSGDSQFSGRGGADTFTATAGQMTITDLGVGDIVELNGGTVVATVQNSFTATSGTDNAGAVGDFTLNVAGVGINVDLTSAGVTGAGYTVASTGTGFVTGSAGADAITNTSGSATITGGGGGDTLVGGTGVDTFVFSATAAANGLDTITTFTAGTDKIDLNAFETVGTLTNLLSATDALAAGEVFYLFSQGTNAADSAAGAIGAIDGTATMTDTAVTSWLVISDDNSTGVFEWTGNGGADGAANDTLTLVATLDAIMTAPADIVIV